MARIYLQNMVGSIGDERLSANWSDFDFVSFSTEKRLWDYQRNALRNAVKLLWKYYEEFCDYSPAEDSGANDERKRNLWQWYLDNGLSGGFSIDLEKMEHHNISSLLTEYYEASDEKISYRNFINRMAFWMATGSGKTLVIVKLTEILWLLMKRGEIPPHDILVLTHRDDLIEQLKRHVEEFNRSRGDFHIYLRELREHPQIKREMPSLFGENELTVFYYRSDNLSDEQKEKIIDFRNYDNDGRWFVLLDEAHKGDKEESKRQHIYSIMSRNGFLFNFSATFTDERDIATTVFNFNLSKYIRAGYGKHIVIMKQEMRAFRDSDDYTGEEKQKIVLKALMLLAFVHKVAQKVREGDGQLYHKPLMLVLVHSVNTEDADLQLFFRELERIGRGEIDEKIFNEAKDELWDELRERPGFMFENSERLSIKEEEFRELSYKDILRLVFNAGSHGEIEVLVRPSNRQEIAFKLKTADRPFALVKIGDISHWLKEKLEGYEVNEKFEDESYFERLNEDDSDINILMGSRTFYEGWDSNRPNVICYINIGVGEDARKFILQSVGRGVRIEPMKNKRRRLLQLRNSGEVSSEDFERLKEWIQSLETLFVFGTNRDALQTVVEGLKQERAKTGEQQLNLFEVNPGAGKKTLLIPIYKKSERPLAESKQLSKFEIAKEEFETLKQFVQVIDDRVLLALCDTSPQLLKVLRRSVNRPENFYTFDGRRTGDLLFLLRRVIDYMGVVPEEFDRLKELEDEINHFRHITVTLTDIGELKNKAERVREYQDPSAMRKELRERLKRGDITDEEFDKVYEETTKMVREESFEYEGKRITIKHIAQHYYLPLVLSEDEKVDYIRHIIKTKSEVEFINELEKCLNNQNNKFNQFNWWLFSKLDESLDEIYLPYYDPKGNRIAKFKPDFIFWLQKGKRYFIVFVDPKGTEHYEWRRKVEGYKAVFEENCNPKVFRYNGWEVSVHLYLHTKDIGKSTEDDRKYWFDDIDSMLCTLQL